MKPDRKSLLFLNGGGWRKMVAGSGVELLALEIYGVVYNILSTKLRNIIPESEIVKS
jgi:predicted secreted protein